MQDRLAVHDTYGINDRLTEIHWTDPDSEFWLCPEYGRRVCWKGRVCFPCRMQDKLRGS